MWVKICGNTNVEDAQLALDAGADALGFVLAAASPRRVTAEQVTAILAELPAETLSVGVFVDADFAEIAQAVETAGLRAVQLHGPRDASLALRLRERFGRELTILQVLHDSEALAAELRALAAEPGAVDAVLVDSRTATAPGGTGLRFDWERARSGFAESAGQLRVIAAGGLSPENVAEAIATLRPWGVDVVSGVEAAPGRKDPEKVRRFVERARAAALELRSLEQQPSI